jgi:hypothetical protein
MYVERRLRPVSNQLTLTSVDVLNLQSALHSQQERIRLCGHNVNVGV